MLQKKSGYILTLTLLLVFLSMFMVLYIAHKASTFASYAQLEIEQKKAYTVALSGVHLAMSQIVSPKVAQKEEQETKSKPTEEEKIKNMLTVILPGLNRWQEIQLTEQREGIDATVKWCISCENGKIDLNAFYDFEKHQFINAKETQQIFKDLFEKIQKSTAGSDLFGEFEKILKERKYRFNDPTELLTKQFEQFKDAIFYEPEGTTHKKIYLNDIFTVWTGKRSINPWLLSEGLITLIGGQSGQETPIVERKKMVAQWLKPFKLNAQWQSDWDKLLKPLYGKEFNGIPKSLQSLLSSTFEARVFSVLSSATVGRVTQRLLAIVESSSTRQPIIKKVYWL